MFRDKTYISLDGLSYKKRLDKIMEYKDNPIVFYYICSECYDEQVTNDFEFSSIEDLKDSITDNNDLMVRLECTNCGSVELLIPILELEGFETDF